MDTDFSNPNLIIMVDDNYADRFIAGRVFKNTGLEHSFLAMESGRELLEYLDEAKSGKRPIPSAILLDINMPGLNGFEVLRELRAQEEFQDRPPITMFTNSDRMEDRQLSMELGANDFRTKPTDLNVYADVFRSLVA
ncbi:response regulator [Pelagicoccus albus]|uniref:Response regulator n=1 Tax=Pelagicoccus albus TaxID=415222 RepID=A0A7X1B7M8_9BACT|nr:response regulator [Pelagicoccus albus]MBC2607152.1 response regulator [Pelagicoccus albus]